MSEERLNEIKDSVNFQRKLLLAHNMNTLCVDEEQELIEEIDRLNNIIKELSKDVDMWNKKYNEQFNIINELEKWVKDYIEKYDVPDTDFICAYLRDILDKIEALKEK